MFYCIKAIVVVFLIADMYKDGYWKRTGVLLYGCKYVMYLCMFLFGWFAKDYLLDWQLYVSILLFKKPVSDISYALGYKKTWFYIGTTNWSDRLLHRLGWVELEQKKFPIITFVYGALLFIGFLLY